MKYSGERFLPDSCSGEIAIEHYQRYQFAHQFIKDKIVLDAACGEGYGSNLLAQSAKMVIGLDIDKICIETASAKYGNSALHFVHGSIAELPFEDSFFDIVISYETIEHVDADIQILFLKEIKRVLRPDGILVMSTPNKAVYTDMVSGNNPFHLREFYIEEYLNFLQGYFNHVQKICQYPDLAYFIANEEESVKVTHPGSTIEHSRYVIAICSDGQLSHTFHPEALVSFDDGMYYSLYSNVHRLENELLDTKKEADTFQDKLEENILTQKKYIAKLETEINKQKEYICHLENDISSQNEYIHHLETDIQTNNDVIAKFHKKQEEYNQYVQHLETDINTLTQYSRHLEADIKMLNQQLQEIGDADNV